MLTQAEASSALAGVSRVISELEAGSGVQMYPEYADDPLGFMVNVLGDEPWSAPEAYDLDGIPEDVRDLITGRDPCGQDDVLEAVVEDRFIAVAGAKGLGKTWLLGRLPIWWCHTRPGGLCITIATTGTQVRGQVWGELETALNESKVPLMGKLTFGGNPAYSLGPKHGAIGLSPRRSESLRGWHGRAQREGFSGPVLVIVDETSGVDDEMLDACFGLLTNPGSKMVWTSNFSHAYGAFHDVFFPRFGAGFMARMSSEAKAKSERASLFRTFRMTFFDAPPWVVDREFELDTRGRCVQAPRDDERYRRDILALPPKSASELAFPYEFLVRISEVRPPVGGRHLGVDIGHSGPDPCVAILTENLVPVAVKTWSGEDETVSTMRTARIIERLMLGGRVEDPHSTDRGWDVPASHVHIDATSGSLGVGVAERLWELGHKVDAVSFSNKPDPSGLSWWRAQLGQPVPDFPRNRQLLYWLMRHCMIQGLAAVPMHEELAPLWEELTAIPFEGDGDQFRIPKKDRLIELIGHSNDWSDAYALNFSRAGAAAVRLGSFSGPSAPGPTSVPRVRAVGRRSRRMR